MKKIDYKKIVSNKYAIIALAGAILICGSFMYIGWKENKEQQRREEELAKSIPPPAIDHFKGINLEAEAAIVYDLANNKILYQKNADEVKPLASITKVMTAYTANDFLTSEEVVAIDENALSTFGESGLTKDQQWKFRDLLNFTLFISSNDGAKAIANVTQAVKGINLVEEMNKKAKNLNLGTLKFNNETGLDVDGTEITGGYGSARDVAVLFSHIISENPALLEVTRNDAYAFKDIANVRYAESNTDIVVDDIPGILASKTGYTNMAGGNLAIAMDAGLNRPIIIVVLGSSQEGRFTDVLSLAERTQKSL